MGRFQDTFSSLKKALTSDTGKKVIGTLAAGAVGGSGGMKAFSGAIDSIKAEEEKRKLKAKQDLIDIENADIRKVNMDKTKLGLRREQYLQDNQGKTDAENREIRAVNLDKAKTGLALEKQKLTESLLPENIAGTKDYRFKNAVAMAKEKAPKSTEIKPPTAKRLTAFGDAEDQEKFVQGSQASGADWAAEVFNENPEYKGLTPKSFKAGRKDILADVKTKIANPSQQQGAWREMNKQAMPGEYERNAAITAAGANPIYTPEENRAIDQERVGRAAYGTGGAIIGGIFGAPLGPIGSAALATVGGMAGNYLARYVFNGQDDAAPTPAVVGSTAAGMSQYGGSSDVDVISDADRIYKGLIEAGVNTNEDFMAALPQLQTTSDFKSYPPDKQAVLVSAIARKYPSRAEIGNTPDWAYNQPAAAQPQVAVDPTTQPGYRPSTFAGVRDMYKKSIF